MKDPRHLKLCSENVESVLHVYSHRLMFLLQKTKVIEWEMEALCGYVVLGMG